MWSKKILGAFFKILFCSRHYCDYKKFFVRFFPPFICSWYSWEASKKNSRFFPSHFFPPDIRENLQKICQAFLIPFFCFRHSFECKKIFGAFLKIHFFALDIIVIIKNFTRVFPSILLLAIFVRISKNYRAFFSRHSFAPHIRENFQKKFRAFFDTTFLLATFLWI